MFDATLTFCSTETKMESTMCHHTGQIWRGCDLLLATNGRLPAPLPSPPVPEDTASNGSSTLRATQSVSHTRNIQMY